jgi:hypothetical protein
MHSEMMAVNSALASSSTLAASTASYIKPYITLSRHHPKPGVLRDSDAVKSYVERICLDAMGTEYDQRTSAAQGDEWRFEAGASRCDASVRYESQSDSEPEQEQEDWLEEKRE